MTLLNVADAVKLGASDVDKVYLGDTQVWPAVAGGGGNVFVSDSFTGADTLDITLRAGETGANWTKVAGGSYGGSAQIISNRAQIQSNYALLYTDGIPATAEYDVEADFYVRALSGGFTAITARKTADDDVTEIEAGYDGDSGMWIMRHVVTASFTSDGSYTQVLTVGQTYHVKLQVRNATKKLLIDDVERITTTDNTITAAGRAGITGGVSGIDIDNFTATDA